MDRRTACMRALYAQGHTLQQIGDRYHITRERVRQILTKYGITREDGGIHTKKRLSAQARHAADNAYCMAKHGCTRAQWRSIPSEARNQFRSQRNLANHRQIEWKLTLWQWWNFWLESGKYEQRGRGADKYVMARVNDVGAYEIGNIIITTFADNARQSRLNKPSVRRPANLRGVYHLYPGLAKPWIAQYRKQRLGYFSTQEEALAARRQAMERA